MLSALDALLATGESAVGASSSDAETIPPPPALVSGGGHAVPLIGREADLALLRTSWLNTHQQGRQLVLISGEAESVRLGSRPNSRAVSLQKATCWLDGAIRKRSSRISRS